MGFEESGQENHNLEKQIPKVERNENNFLDSNPYIKKIGENVKSQYPKFDLDNFGNFVQKLLEDNKVKKEDLNKYLENILKEYLKVDNNFIFDYEDEDLSYRAKSEIVKNIKKETKKTEKKTNEIEKETTRQLIFNKINYQSKLYQSIPNKFKINTDSKEFKKFKDENINKVKDKLYNYGIDVDEYFTHRYTAQQLSKSGETLPNKYEFIKSFNQLNNLLDIDIQIPLVDDKVIDYKPLPDSLDDFQSQAEKIFALDDVKNYIDSSPDILVDKDISINNGDIIKLYSGRIPGIISGILSKNNLDQNLIKYFDVKNYDEKSGILNPKEIKVLKDSNDPKDKEVLEQIQKISKTVCENFIKEGKEEILKITNKTVKEKIMTSVFRGVSEFFDITNKNIENFSSDFRLDFAQDLKMENNVVKIDGMINGSFVGLYYDLNTGKLKIDDVVTIDEENKIYKIGKKTGALLDVSIKLPKLNDFYDDTKKFDYKYVSRKSENIDVYKNNLDKELGSVFYGNFVHKEFNQYYIRRINEKNLAVQSALKYSFDNRSMSAGKDKSLDMREGIEFKKDLNPGHWEFAKMVDDSFEYYSKSDKLLKIRNLFEKFDMIINSKNVREGISNEKIINQLFNSQEMTRSANEWKSMGNTHDFNYLKFYRLISKSRGDRQIIDIDLFEKIVEVLEKGESLEDRENKRKFGGDFWCEYEKIVGDPDQELEKALGQS